MSSQGRIFQGRFHTLFVSALILCIAIVVSGCDGGGGATGTSSPTPSQTNSSLNAIILKADPGSVCETLLTGETYTKAPTGLFCNNGADPYTAYLDGSKSTSSTGLPLSYAWSFVSKPAGSNAALTGADTANPNFVPDKAGPYTVQLVVSDSGVSSPRAVALVMALDQAMLNSTSVATGVYVFHGGLTSNCYQCHNGTLPALQSMPSAHLATSNLCQSCHSPAGFSVVSFVDHKEVFGSCSSCHDGVIAVGKSEAHLVTTQECSDCHTTDHFLNLNPDGTFDHTGITRVCSGCHNGKVAIGTESDPNPSGHPSISVECNSCHTTATFKAPFLNHSDTKVVVPGTCGQAGCHDGKSTQSNGVAIAGQNSAPHPHPVTGNITQACDVCHNTTSFNLGGVFDHGVLARHPIACMSCHDGLSAIGKTDTHIATPLNSDCGDCHHTSTFVGGFVDHKSTAVTSKACTDCHNNVNAPGVPTAPPVIVTFHTNAAAAGKTCGDCHTAGGSFALATIDHSGFGTVGNITLPAEFPTCSGCHDDSIATGKSAGHFTTTQDCGVCHSPQRGDWLGATFDHSSAGVSIVGNTSTPTCTSCHDGTSATGKSLTHVPLPTVGQDCLICHGTSYISFALPIFDHTAAGITSNCVSCHDGKAHDGVKVISKPTGHIPTALDCSKCHADTANGPSINGTILSGFRKADPFVNTLHPAFTAGCNTCHISTYNNAIYNAKSQAIPLSTTHATANSKGWDCYVCHTTTGNFLETAPVNHQDPAIKAQTCISCHKDNQKIEPIGRTTATHPSLSNTACQNCHQAGGSFTAGFDHATLTGTNKGLACAGCHDGTTATGKVSNHMATSRDCAVCHAGYPPTAATFAGGTFSHTGPEMTGKQCATCHTGNIAGALGKTPDHVVTNADCGACHSTTAFTPASSFNHTGVTTGCAASGCHASGTAGVVDVTDDPNPLPHIPIVVSGAEVNCYSCHKNAGGTFANATMDHSVVTSIACETCHDGKHDGSNTAHAVTGKTVGTTTIKGHFVTSVVACVKCHTSTTAWTPVAVTFYKHLPNPPGYIPVSPATNGNHNTTKVPKCVTCHKDTKSGAILINGNADISTFPHATYGTTCAACHASKGESRHGKPLSTKYQNCGASGCHRISSSSF